MKIKKLIQVTVIASSLIALSGCARHHAATMGDGAYGMDGSAQAAGLGRGENFGGDGSGYAGTRHASNNTYYFDFDSNAVHDQDKPAIYSHGNKLASNPTKHVVVEGHTDPRGSREYNIALGERRANAVAELMRSKGAKGQQVHVVSYGAQRPAMDGHSEEAYQMDRRAKIEG